jgi:hypothetical protein
VAESPRNAVHGGWFGHAKFFNPTACASNYEFRYLTTGALPAQGTVCQQSKPPSSPAGTARRDPPSPAPGDSMRPVYTTAAHSQCGSYEAYRETP